MDVYTTCSYFGDYWDYGTGVAGFDAYHAGLALCCICAGGWHFRGGCRLLQAIWQVVLNYRWHPCHCARYYDVFLAEYYCYYTALLDSRMGDRDGNSCHSHSDLAGRRFRSGMGTGHCWSSAAAPRIVLPYRSWRRHLVSALASRSWLNCEWCAAFHSCIPPNIGQHFYCMKPRSL